MSFFLICLQLKLISSLCGLRFGWTNRFTVSGNPISVTFSCHLAQFFCQFFWEKISVRETDNCFEWITKAMTCLDIRFMNFNDYFPENLYTFILQLPPFHTKWDTVNNDIISTALLVHFVPNYIGTFKQSLKCFNSVFRLIFSARKACITILFLSEGLVLIASISPLSDSMALSSSFLLTMLPIGKRTVNDNW